MLVSTSEGHNQETSGLEIQVGESRFAIMEFDGTAVVEVVSGSPFDMVYNPMPPVVIMDDMLAQMEAERDMYEQEVNGWMN